MTLTQGLDFIADSINPCLLVLAFSIPWVQTRRPPWRFWGCTLLSLTVVYLIQWGDQRFQLWPSVGLDYSTHTAFAVAVIVSLGAWQRRWFFILAPVLLVYAALMIRLDYHSLADIVTATLVIGPLAWGIHQIGRDKGRRQALRTNHKPAS